jgi:YidC/Oxa1 family membrane protein insertase
LKHDQSELIWELQANRHEKNRENEITSTEMQYQLAVDEDVDNFNSTSADEELVEEALNWVAYRQQFFTTILQLKGASFSKAALAIRPLEDEAHTKYMASSISYPSKASGELDLEMGLYLGPNKYEILKSYDAGFEELIPLGWGILGWINRGIVLNIFNWLEAYGLNYGLIILIIALIIKMILFPLTYSSYRSMAKMRVLKPEIDALAEKHPDAMKKQQATMELYRKAGVSPLGGCLPMLLQFPILIALFQFFPASIELRQQSFLWATDLSTYDSIYDLPFTIPFYGDHISLFTLLMTVSTLIYTYMNQQLTGSAQTQQFPQMKYIIYLMPIMFLGVFNNYASGLSYYYFVANVITFSQQFAIRSFIDEDKIKAKIAERKEKPQKENRLMRRMREVQEQQNRQQRRTK